MNEKELISLLIDIESDGDDNAHGDLNLEQQAYGPLQIRQPVCDDVNRVYGTSLRAEQMQGNRALSIDTFRKYMSIYATKKQLGFTPTPVAMARIWNGGPKGWCRKATLGYREKFMRECVERGLEPFELYA